MHNGPGYQICSDIERPSISTINSYKEFETPDVSDMLNRMYSMNPQIQNRVNNKSIVGPAVTVKVFPGDNLMVHKALDLIKEGDIIVVDTCSTYSNSVIGDIIAQKAKHRGAAGFVIDGLIRDIPGLKDINLPIYAKGNTPVGPLHRGPGEINFPVSCGGIVVNPGDIISADSSGVVVIKKEFSKEILVQLIEQQCKNNEYIANVKKGIFSNDWVDNILAESGFIIKEETKKNKKKKNLVKLTRDKKL